MPISIFCTAAKSACGKVRRAKLYYLRDRRGKSARIVEKTNYRAPKGAVAAE